MRKSKADQNTALAGKAEARCMRFDGGLNIFQLLAKDTLGFGSQESKNS
jgi:hypothetical protein